jgi:multidrug efflux pump
MTSLAFILGVLPLVLATGAGAEMRRSLGTAVFSGMLGVTAFGIFLTPVFFDLVQRAVDSQFFGPKVMRFVGLTLLGGVVGSGISHLAAQLMHYEWLWPSVIGAIVGIVVVFLVPLLRGQFAQHVTAVKTAIGGSNTK